MCEAILYFILGCVLILGLFWSAKVDRTSGTPPEKQILSSPKGCCGCNWVLLPVVVVMGIFFLVMSVVLASGLYEDWSECRLLNRKGQLKTVPLLRIEKEYNGKKWVYEAAYQIDGSTREQSISKRQYERFKSQTGVEVLTYDDASMIVGTKPAYFLILPITTLGSLGAIITGAVVAGLLWDLWKRVRPQNNPAS